MKMYFLTKDGKTMHAVSESLVEHWEKHGAKIQRVMVFQDIAPYYPTGTPADGNAAGAACTPLPPRNFERLFL